MNKKRVHLLIAPNFLKALFGILIITNLISPHSQAAKITKRKVELEWEDQPQAKYYDIEVYQEDGSTLFKAYKNHNNIFKQTLPLGTYKVRSRFVLKSDQASPWSQLEPLEVQVPVGKIKNIEGETFHKVNLASGVAKVPLEWTELQNIKSYRLDIKDKSGKKVFSTKTQKSPFNVNLPAGEYRYCVTPFDEYGNEGDPSEDSPALIVSSAQLPPPLIEGHKQDEALVDVQWKAYRSANLEGQLFFRKIMATEWIPKKIFKDIKKSPWTAPPDLEPGEYQIQFRATAQGADASDSVFIEFLVKPKKPDLLISP